MTSTDVSEKYKLALKIIQECDGHLPDDTYLEKVITETEKKVRVDPDLFDLWGLHDFVRRVLQASLSESSTPLVEFALKTLASCCVDKIEVEREVTKLLERIPAVLAGSPTGLELLHDRSPEYLEQQGAFEKVIGPALEQGVTKSIFWHRSLCKLTTKYLLHLLSKSLENEAARDSLESVLKRVFLSGKRRAVKTIIPMFLLATLKTDASVEKERTRELIKLTLETHVDVDEELSEDNAASKLLFLAVIDADAARDYCVRILRDWPEHESRTKMRDILSAVVAAKNSNSSIGIPVTSACLTIIESEIAEKKRFRKTEALLRQSKSLFSEDQVLRQRLCRCLRQVIETLVHEPNDSPSHDMDDDEASALISVALPAFEATATPQEFERDWQLLAAVVQEPEFGANAKIKLLESLRRILERTEDLSCHQLGELFPDALWRLARGHHWGVEDCFLSLLTSALSAKCQVQFEVSSLVQNLARCSIASENSFLRSSGFALLTAMASSSHFDCLECFDLNQMLTRSLVEETEAIVRRSAVKFARQFFKTRSWTSSKTSEIQCCLITSVNDLDCETRDEALALWHDQLEVQLQKSCDKGAVWKSLEASGVVEAFETALRSSDRVGKARLYKILQRIRPLVTSESPSAKKKRRELEVFLTNCEENLSEKEIVEEFCELQMGLNSVLTDLIQSVRPESQLDGADCV